MRTLAIEPWQILITIGVFCGFFAGRWQFARTISKNTAKEKTRLRAEIIGTEPESGSVDGQIFPDRRLELLIEYYAGSLTQFKATFRVSLALASAGTFVVILGAVVALYRSDTFGAQIAASTVSLAGAISSLIGGVLFAYSARSIKHLDSQTLRLREDCNLDRSFDRNVELLKQIGDSQLKDLALASLALHQPLAGLHSESASRSREEVSGENRTSQAVPTSEAT